MRSGLLIVLGLVVLVGCTTVAESEARGAMTLYKSSNCGCCTVYGKVAAGEGYAVDVKVDRNAEWEALRAPVPDSMRSCHTAVVDGYLVEGHVPLEAVEKLLEERPDIAGIALPGMPSGSPGMPGPKRGEFVVYAIGHDGSAEEFVRI